MLVVAFRLHLHTPSQRHAIDYLGAALLTAGVSALILVTTWGGNEYAWGSAPILGLAAAGVALLAAFVWQERRAAEPIIPLELFRSSVFRVASGVGFVIGLAMFGAIVFIPLFLQLVYGVSPTSSGLRMLPLMAGLLVASIISGRIISRLGRYKAFPIAGTAITTLGLFLLSRLEVDTDAVARLGLHARGRRRHRPRDAGARARRAERRAGAQHRRRHLDRDVLPLDGRLARRRDLRRDLRVAAGATSWRRIPGAAGLSGGANIRPDQVHALPAGVRHDFLIAFVHSLQPVFLVGAAFTAVAFVLAWTLREVPLRTSNAAAPAPPVRLEGGRA